jgi:outer membrane protein assembly factor BamB/predicted MPP superfamily phosphohydrolase
MINRTLSFGLAITLCLLLFVSASHSVETFTFVQITDAHVSDSTSQADLKRVLDDVLSLEQPPAFILATGDLSDFGQKSTLSAYKEIMDTSGLPYYSLLGNHDTRWSGLSRDQQTHLLQTPNPVSFLYNGVQIIGLNSGLPLEAWGHISPEQISWMKSEVDALPANMPRIVASHHPYLYPDRNYMPPNEELLALLERTPVSLYLNGHGHSFKHWELNGVRHQMGGATVHKRTYLLIHVDTDSIRIDYREAGRETPLDSRTMSLLPPDPSLFHLDRVVQYEEQNRLSIAVDWPDGPPADSLIWHIQRNEGPWLPASYDPEQQVVQDTLDRWHTGFNTLSLRARDASGAYRFRSGTFERSGTVGRPLWTRELDERVQAAVYAQDHVITATGSGRIVALDPETGRLQWQQMLEGSIRKGLVVTDRDVFAATTSGLIASLSPQDGRIRWRRQLDAAINAEPRPYQDVVYVATGSGSLYQLDRDTGQQRWSAQTGDHIQAQPWATDSTVFVGSWDRHFYAIDAGTGSVRWTRVLHDSKYFAPATASPITGGDNIIFIGAAWGEGAPSVYGCDPDSGEIRWTYPLSAHYSSPVVVDSLVILGAIEGRLYALNVNTGELAWEVPTGEALFDSSPVVYGDEVYISTLFGSLFQVDVSTGTVHNRYQLGKGFVFSPIAYQNGTVYAATLDGRVMALEVSP